VIKVREDVFFIVRDGPRIDFARVDFPEPEIIPQVTRAIVVSSGSGAINYAMNWGGIPSMEKKLKESQSDSCDLATMIFD